MGSCCTSQQVESQIAQVSLPEDQNENINETPITKVSQPEVETQFTNTKSVLSRYYNIDNVKLNFPTSHSFIPLKTDPNDIVVPLDNNGDGDDMNNAHFQNRSVSDIILNEPQTNDHEVPLGVVNRELLDQAPNVTIATKFEIPTLTIDHSESKNETQLAAQDTEYGNNDNNDNDNNNNSIERQYGIYDILTSVLDSDLVHKMNIIPQISKLIVEYLIYDYRIKLTEKNNVLNVTDTCDAGFPLDNALTRKGRAGTSMYAKPLVWCTLGRSIRSRGVRGKNEGSVDLIIKLSGTGHAADDDDNNFTIVDVDNDGGDGDGEDENENGEDGNEQDEEVAKQMFKLTKFHLLQPGINFTMPAFVGIVWLFKDKPSIDDLKKISDYGKLKKDFQRLNSYDILDKERLNIEMRDKDVENEKLPIFCRFTQLSSDNFNNDDDRSIHGFVEIDRDAPMPMDTMIGDDDNDNDNDNEQNEGNDDHDDQGLQENSKQQENGDQDEEDNGDKSEDDKKKKYYHFKEYDLVNDDILQSDKVYGEYVVVKLMAYGDDNVDTQYLGFDVIRLM